MSETLRKAEHEMVVCNACRYCEAYCPVFQAMEQRVTFSSGDLTYLANLCHNCGECLYACQYAPPHEFGIDVPKTMASNSDRTRVRRCGLCVCRAPLYGAPDQSGGFLFCHPAQHDGAAVGHRRPGRRR